MWVNNLSVCLHFVSIYQIRSDTGSPTTGAQTFMPWQPNKLERERLDKLQRIKERGIDPYPNRVGQTHTAAQASAPYEPAEPNGEAPEASQRPVAGATRSVRATRE